MIANSGASLAVSSSFDDLSVLIVDDTIVYRSILTRVVETIENVQVAGTASNGEIALSKLSQSPVDVVLLDVEMPKMDGLETLRIIRQRYPHLGVIMVSATNRSSADITIQALEAGALDFIPKPENENIAQNTEELRNRLIPLFRHYVINRGLRFARSQPQPAARSSAPQVLPSPSALPSAPAQKPSAEPPVRRSPALASLTFKADLVVIGVSTGGPNALMEVIPHLPENLGVPVLMVQHMPPVFTASLADSLNRRSRLRVKEAELGEIIMPNTVYIAPGGKHMLVQGSGPVKQIVLNEDPHENSCRPAVDVLFRSVAESYCKANILAIVLTGMGKDGAAGVKRLKQGSCYSLVQDEPSCVVYGMPKAVYDLGLADEQLDLRAFPERITQLVRK